MMGAVGVPEWSRVASESIGILYRDLQPIEIYVEDSKSEVFYLELLNRIIGEDNRIKKVIALHGKEHVISFCERYTVSNPVLFLIDGDFDLVLDKRVKGKRNLYQLTAYCIENYLICRDAARELIVEGSGTLHREEVFNSQEWDDFLGSIEINLKELFLVFATSRLINREIKTVSLGIGNLCSQISRKGEVFLDNSKIEKLKESIVSECIKECGVDEWEALYASVMAKSKDVRGIDLVSGKDFLLPFMSILIQKNGVQTGRTESLMFRLAKHCSLDRLDGLRVALNKVLDGGEFRSE